MRVEGEEGSEREKGEECGRGYRGENQNLLPQKAVDVCKRNDVRSERIRNVVLRDEVPRGDGPCVVTRVRNRCDRALCDRRTASACGASQCGIGAWHPAVCSVPVPPIVSIVLIRCYYETKKGVFQSPSQ
jgi:hypothetical protein